MLKWKLDKQAYDALDDATKAFYKASGVDYVLNAEPDPQIKDLDKQIKSLQSDIAAKKDFVDPKTIPDAAAIQSQLEAEKSGRASDISKLQGYIADALVGEKATDIAAKVFKNPSVMKRFVADALTVDFTGDKPAVKVKGLDGKLNDDFDGLMKSFSENKDYADFVIASKASGGGVKQTTIPQKPQLDQQVDLAKTSASDLVARVEARLASKGA